MGATVLKCRVILVFPTRGYTRKIILTDIKLKINPIFAFFDQKLSAFGKK